jgi:CTP:molybdopterin cytidylyltransferase MocA
LKDSRLERRVGAVILAAGASTRLGYPKQLIEHEGEALVRRAAMSALEAGADPVIVVVGASAETVSEALVGLEGIDVLYNARWESGLASSLAAGLEAVRAYPKCDGALVMVADQPLIDVASLRQLMEAFDSDDRIVASAYDDIVGVPIVLGAEFFKDLMNLKGDEGAGRWLRARLKDVTQIPVASASMDIDTPADAERLASDTSTDQ